MILARTLRHLRFAALLLGFSSLGSACDDPAETPPSADAALEPDAAPAPDAAAPESLRGNRYCEILLAFLQGGVIEAQVWGTQGLNDCPETAWASIDRDAIRAEFGATAVVANGPRYWVIDGAEAELPEGSRRLFGTLEMQKLATVTLGAGTTSSTPYVERTIRRTSVFEFRTGSEVYELVGPDGSVHVMQSYAQIVDADLSESDLPGLGARLVLPDGWSYRARTLDAPLVVRTPGEATVVQDELQNTYSRHVDGG